MAKKYDLAVKTSTYKNADGLEKGRYETLGEIHTGRDGGFFARMNSFRLLGIAMAAVARGDDSIIVSLFTAEQPTNQPAAASMPSSPRPSAPRAEDYNDDIPF